VTVYLAMGQLVLSVIFIAAAIPDKSNPLAFTALGLVVAAVLSLLAAIVQVTGVAVRAANAVSYETRRTEELDLARHNDEELQDSIVFAITDPSGKAVRLVFEKQSQMADVLLSRRQAEQIVCTAVLAIKQVHEGGQQQDQQGEPAPRIGGVRQGDRPTAPPAVLARGTTPLRPQLCWPGATIPCAPRCLASGRRKMPGSVHQMSCRSPTSEGAVTSLCRYAWEANISDNDYLDNLVKC
jgi:hypothetical protein